MTDNDGKDRRPVDDESGLGAGAGAGVGIDGTGSGYGSSLEGSAMDRAMDEGLGSADLASDSEARGEVGLDPDDLGREAERMGEARTGVDFGKRDPSMGSNTPDSGAEANLSGDPALDPGYGSAGSMGSGRDLGPGPSGEEPENDRRG
jgi:hypothetical protein